MPTVFGIPMSFDPAASVLALVAVYIAVVVFRATSTHRSRIVEFKSSFFRDAKGMFNRVEVVIRNTGLPIRNGSVHLEFDMHAEDGRVQRTKVALGKKLNDAFDFGALGRFALEIPHPVSPKEQVTAKWLSCFARQSRTQTRPRIVICSGEFEVLSIDLVSRFDRLLCGWNRAAFWINGWFDRRGTYGDGQQWIKPGKVLPVVGLQAWFALQHLGQTMSRELSECDG